jgi:hypothetical protein
MPPVGLEPAILVFKVAEDSKFPIPRGHCGQLFSDIPLTLAMINLQLKQRLSLSILETTVFTSPPPPAANHFA